ncbi:MFS general substrate transporter [Pleomassaria siparia CBS 279.74]|uniref:MFS general substrate transporter n=1 Tax=Pleomassaria siparia CBS 279.74 TaxID=1314801 RepID=A0A6G1K311_9PLEO|nr:MFS general substrate transporter [Pleomassaria siparia CBS 279.74]
MMDVEKAIPYSDSRPAPRSFSPITQAPPLHKTKSATSAVIGRVASHLTTRSITNPGPPPDGGFRAWVQVFCAWLAIMNTWGFVNSFGAFQPYYEEILPQSPSMISWIGSTQASLLFILGLFSGRALDAGLFRPTIILGITLQLVGIFTMSLAKNYWQLLLTQGICTGVGGGLFFVPVMGLVSTYFAKRRGMAIGIVTSGNSLGGIIYPLVVREMLPKVGFGWTVRVLGFINVVALVVVIAFMKPRLPPRNSGPLVDWDALKDRPYVLQVLGFCCLIPPVYFGFYYIASFARDELHMPYAHSLNLVILINGSGIPTRVFIGMIADRYGLMNTIAVTLFIDAICIFSWLAVSTLPSYYVFTAFYGAASAAFQALFPTSVTTLSNDITKTGTRLGMAFTVIGIAALVGGPIAGLLVKGRGGYTSAICWAGASTVLGMGLGVTARGLKYGWRWKTIC